MSTCLLACCGLDTPIVRDQPIEFLWGSEYDPVFTWGALALLALASLVAK
jgi:hypothetical protein